MITMQEYCRNAYSSIMYIGLAIEVKITCKLLLKDYKQQADCY